MSEQSTSSPQLTNEQLKIIEIENQIAVINRSLAILFSLIGVNHQNNQTIASDYSRTEVGQGAILNTNSSFL